MKATAFFTFVFFILLFLPFSVDARSGCCSSHKGVCGCGCCDGSPLSATCLPYYPECSGGSQRTAPVQEELIYIPPTKYIPPPTRIPTNTPYPTVTQKLTSIPIPTSTKKRTSAIKPKRSISANPISIEIIQPNKIISPTPVPSRGIWGWLTNLFK